MNKETITKYEKEFLAWCKNESVLLGAPTSMHDKTLIWREVRDFNDWKPLDTVYVLNDSYSHYRKALAEGKVVQFKHPQVGFEKWKIVTPEHSFQSVVPGREYRVKPEKPKFKVGDFVVFPNGVKEIITTSEENSISTASYPVIGIHTNTYASLKLWKPKPGEWCWFWNKDKLPVVAKLSELYNEGNGKYFAIIPNKPYSLGAYYENCEPFIGQLPSFLKDLQ